MPPLLFAVEETNMAIYMKIDGIDGQVTTAGHVKWIELHSAQYNVSRAVHTGAGGANREGSHPTINDITISKVFDVASTHLYREAVAGSFDKKVKIAFTATTKGKTETYLELELTDCGISSYSLSSGGDQPTEGMSLNFTKIMYTPSPLDDNGSPKKGAIVKYDLLEMKAS
jgi:type VI secretion system secreted protein Hcp